MAPPPAQATPPAAETQPLPLPMPHVCCPGGVTFILLGEAFRGHWRPAAVLLVVERRRSEVSPKAHFLTLQPLPATSPQPWPCSAHHGPRVMVERDPRAHGSYTRARRPLTAAPQTHGQASLRQEEVGARPPCPALGPFGKTPQNPSQQPCSVPAPTSLGPTGAPAPRVDWDKHVSSPCRSLSGNTAWEAAGGENPTLTPWPVSGSGALPSRCLLPLSPPGEAPQAIREHQPLLQRTPHPMCQSWEAQNVPERLRCPCGEGPGRLPQASHRVRRCWPQLDGC